MSISTYRTGSGELRYRVRYRKPDGTQTDRRGFKRKKDAQLWEADHVTVAIAKGSYVDPTSAKSTIGDLWPAWIAKKKVNAKPSYLDDLEGSWRKYVATYWANISIGKVSRAGVQQWVGDMTHGRVDGKAKSASVVLRAYGILAGILDDAVADNLIPHNPARGVSLPRKPRRTRHTYLNARQLFALADACGPYRVFVLTLGLTGLRWGEATGLTIRDVDLDRRRFDINKSATEVCRRIVVGTPKTHELRTVMFPAMLGPLLPVRGKGDDDLLFADPTSPTGYIMQVDSPKTGSSWFTRACDAAGVPRMTVHDLRHTAASLMVRSGANVKAVQRQLGHASAAMTLDVYADLFDDDLDAVSESMNRLLIDANVGNMWAREGILTA